MPAWYTQADALKLHQIPPAGPAADIPLMAPIQTIPGVILLGASHRNMPGKGAIRSEGEGNRLSWRAPGSSTFGPASEVNVDSDVLLRDGDDVNRYLRARVKTAYLQGHAAERAVYLQHLWNALFSDVTAAEASTGVTKEVPNIFLRNVSAGTIYNIRAWIEPGTPYLEISPDGVAWSAPTTEATGLQLGTLLPLTNRVFRQRSVIPPATAYNPKVQALIHLRFDGI